MKTVSEVPITRDIAHDSLGDILRRITYAQLPSRFHVLAQLGFPLAYQLWNWGLPRTAGWLAVLSLVSIWAMAEQRLTGRADSELQSVPGSATQLTGWRIVRRFGATAAAILSVGLILEAFAQIMASVFKCPGCSG